MTTSKLAAYRLTDSDGKSWRVNMAAGVTLAQARECFIGFVRIEENLETGEETRLARVVSVDRAGETPRGAYANAPHKTIEELKATAEARASAGEDGYDVRQDIITGYGFDFGSASDREIAAACERGVRAFNIQRGVAA